MYLVYTKYCMSTSVISACIYVGMYVLSTYLVQYGLMYVQGTVYKDIYCM